MEEEQFLNGQWALVGPAVTCPVTTGPVALAPGDSLRVNWFFATGQRRIVLGVAGKPDLSDAALDASAAFDVP
jgi:hypothetical protein